MYTVKEVSEMLGLTEHTVRYYADRGLVPNLKRDKNNIRLFDESAVNWLLCAKHLRQCGMHVRDIKTYVDLCLEGDATIGERYDIMKKQRKVTQAQLEEAKRRARYIEEKEENYLNFMNSRRTTGTETAKSRQ